MKFTSVLATVALVSLDRAAAYSTCTWYDAMLILGASNKILLDADCVESMSARCPNAKCYATVVQVTKEVPDCMAGGANSKDIFETLLTTCKEISLGGNSTSTATRSVGVNGKSAPTDGRISTSNTSTGASLTLIADAVAKAFP